MRIRTMRWAETADERPTWSLALLTDCSCGSSKGASLFKATASMLREMRNGLLTGSAAAAKAVGEKPAAVRRMSSAGRVPVIGLQRMAGLAMALNRSVTALSRGTGSEDLAKSLMPPDLQSHTYPHVCMQYRKCFLKVTHYEKTRCRMFMYTHAMLSWLLRT